MQVRKKQLKWLRSSVLGSLAIVLAAVLLVVKAIPDGGWVVVGFLALSATVITLREVVAHREARESAERERIAALRCPPKPVRDSDPFALGVTPSEIANRYRGASDRPPYVSRDVDPDLERFMRDTPFVAVVGPSKAGKSRTAFEALTRVFPQRLLLAPELPSFQRERMAEAISSYIDEAPAGVIVWLDDLQEFLRTRSVATQDVNAWREAYPKVVVIATIRDGELAALRSVDSLGSDIERIVDQAKIVPLGSNLSDKELKEAAAAYPNEDFSDGLGVHLVAGQQLVERFLTAREAQPLGYAITAAAIDRRRAGVVTPATKKELLDLAPSYLQHIRPRSVIKSDEVDDALSWALETVIQDIGLLLREDRDDGGWGYSPFEYMTAYLDGDVAEGLGKAYIPEATWTALIGQNHGWDLRSIGWSAMTRKEMAVAREAFEKLAEDADPHVAAHGVNDLANACWELDDLPEAKRCYESAASSDFICVEPSACYNLAILIQGSGGDAEHWYRRALVDTNASVHPKALVNLGLLLRGKSDVKSRADGSGRGFFSSDRSGLTERDHELEAEAEAFFTEAMRSNDREAVANGGNALGVLLKAQERIEEAENALRQGAEAGSAFAAMTLAEMLSEQGRFGESRAITSDFEDRDLDVRERAYLNNMSAQIALHEGKPEMAIEITRGVIAEGVPVFADTARMVLAELLLENGGSKEEVYKLLTEVVETDDVHAEGANRIIKELREGDNREASESVEDVDAGGLS